MNKIQFASQKKGYNMTQVDEYINKLSYEYKRLHNMYLLLSDKNERHLQVNGSADMEAISKALVDAQVKRIEIIAGAKAEATRIIEEAYKDYIVIEQEKKRILNEAKTGAALIIKELQKVLDITKQDRT